MMNCSRTKLFNVLTDSRMRIHFHRNNSLGEKIVSSPVEKVSNDLLAETQTRLNQLSIRTTRDSLEDMGSVPKDSKNVFLLFYIVLPFFL